nr:hypothetical protein [Defluviicoccus vanus]
MSQPAERLAVEQIEVAREVVTSPVPALEHAEIKTVGIVGHDQQPSARFQQRVDSGQHFWRGTHVLDGLDHQREIIGGPFERQILHRTEVNTQATLACDQSRPLVQVDALQPPGFGAKFLQQPQVETITAADVNNTRVAWKVIANGKKPLCLQSASNFVNKTEARLRKGECMIVVGVNSGKFTVVWAWIQVHKPTFFTLHGEKTVVAGLVLEILADSDGRRVIVTTNTATDLVQGDRCCRFRRAGVHNVSKRNAVICLGNSPLPTNINDTRQ